MSVKFNIMWWPIWLYCIGVLKSAGLTLCYRAVFQSIGISHTSFFLFHVTLAIAKPLPHNWTGNCFLVSHMTSARGMFRVMDSVCPRLIIVTGQNPVTISICNRWIPKALSWNRDSHYSEVPRLPESNRRLMGRWRFSCSTRQGGVRAA